MSRALADVVAALAALAGMLVAVIIGIRSAAIHQRNQHRRLRPSAELSLAGYVGVTTVTGRGPASASGLGATGERRNRHPPARHAARKCCGSRSCR
jgi:hypothetical protein